jgi:hypothetical protein
MDHRPLQLNNHPRSLAPRTDAPETPPIPPPRYSGLRQGLFFRGGPLRRELLVVEGGGGEALSSLHAAARPLRNTGMAAPRASKEGAAHLSIVLPAARWRQRQQAPALGTALTPGVLTCQLRDSRKNPMKRPNTAPWVVVGCRCRYRIASIAAALQYNPRRSFLIQNPKPKQNGLGCAKRPPKTNPKKNKEESVGCFYVGLRFFWPIL